MMFERNPQYAGGIRVLKCTKDTVRRWQRRRGGVRKCIVCRKTIDLGQWFTVEHTGVMDPFWYVKHVDCLVVPRDCNEYSLREIRKHIREVDSRNCKNCGHGEDDHANMTEVANGEPPCNAIAASDDDWGGGLRGAHTCLCKGWEAS